jgi:hypothetical protein
VRLAVFAEMMKDRPWIPQTLDAMGGVQGIDLLFLEDSFGSRATNPARLYHQRAIRQVLTALLPASGSPLKGHRQSREELLAASGYRRRPKDFANLLQILDRELRIITPIDADDDRDPPPEDPESANEDRTTTAAEYYQLTHDFLVPAIREWLFRKQRETRRGRISEISLRGGNGSSSACSLVRARGVNKSGG